MLTIAHLPLSKLFCVSVYIFRILFFCHCTGYPCLDLFWSSIGPVHKPCPSSLLGPLLFSARLSLPLILSPAERWSYIRIHISFDPFLSPSFGARGDAPYFHPVRFIPLDHYQPRPLWPRPWRCHIVCLHTWFHFLFSHSVWGLFWTHWFSSFSLFTSSLFFFDLFLVLLEPIPYRQEHFCILLHSNEIITFFVNERRVFRCVIFISELRQ